MKDVSHHRLYTQKKVLQSVHRESNNSSVATKSNSPEVLILHSPQAMSEKHHRNGADTLGLNGQSRPY
jgi:hypothetical protein